MSEFECIYIYIYIYIYMYIYIYINMYIYIYIYIYQEVKNTLILQDYAFVTLYKVVCSFPTLIYVSKDSVFLDAFH